MAVEQRNLMRLEQAEKEVCTGSNESSEGQCVRTGLEYKQISVADHGHLPSPCLYSSPSLFNLSCDLAQAFLHSSCLVAPPSFASSPLPEWPFLPQPWLVATGR